MSNLAKTKTTLAMKIDAQHRLLVGLAVSAIVLFFIFNLYSAPVVVLLTWMSFAVSVIIMNWVTILSTHPREVRKIAKLQDSSRSMIFVFVIVASMISLLAIVFLLKSAKGHGSASVTGHILLSICAVIISWWHVHTVFTMRYAHLYYDTDSDDGTPKKGGGLEFPGNEEPDYLDFVYFSFVLGMTFQVSDVEISSRGIRRLAWLHSLISFAFNTAIVALSINIISGLVSQ
jgi:uncharacterized membrane protein